MPRVTEVDTFDFNNVIEINDEGPFILHTLLASPGKTRRLGPIKPGLSLQYLKGTWRLMPNAYNYNCCREYLILTPDGWAETKTYPLPPGTEGPSSDLSQIGTNAGRTNYARRVGFWYCVKCAHPTYVVNILPGQRHIFYEMSPNAGQLTRIEVNPGDVRRSLVGF
ncbi:hypothetical protein AX14_010952 [Amanita brunnescens Koide BX004]|nr:hypothetical protein AX14_010952 [Amanita brunnescens Koide BX004]